MSKKEIEKFAIGYPYPTDVVGKILHMVNYDKKLTHYILMNTNKTMAIWQSA